MSFYTEQPPLGTDPELAAYLMRFYRQVSAVVVNDSVLGVDTAETRVTPQESMVRYGEAGVYGAAKGVYVYDGAAWRQLSWI